MVNKKVVNEDGEEFERWFELAEYDLNAAKYNFDGGMFPVAIFLCQQSAEKGLKALMIRMGKDLIKTHDLVRLGREVEAPEEFFNNFIELFNSYTGSRYIPLEDFKKSEVDNFIKFVEEVLLWIRKKI